VLNNPREVRADSLQVSERGTAIMAKRE
jgi:hypothetical protein